MSLVKDKTLGEMVRVLIQKQVKNGVQLCVLLGLFGNIIMQVSQRLGGYDGSYFRKINRPRVSKADYDSKSNQQNL
jgi:hypothetical protein